MVPGKKAGCLVSAHIIVRVDAGDHFILPLDGYHGNRQPGQFPGGDGMALNDQAFNLIGHQLLNVAPFRLFVFITDKYQKLISEILIGGEDLI